MDKSKLIKMELHESTNTPEGDYHILRVVGGWIYCRQEPQVNVANPVFIPFNEKEK